MRIISILSILILMITYALPASAPSLRGAPDDRWELAKAAYASGMVMEIYILKEACK